MALADLTKQGVERSQAGLRALFCLCLLLLPVLHSAPTSGSAARVQETKDVGLEPQPLAVLGPDKPLTLLGNYKLIGPRPAQAQFAAHAAIWQLLQVNSPSEPNLPPISFALYQHWRLEGG